jgi:hypothetical protein
VDLQVTAVPTVEFWLPGLFIETVSVATVTVSEPVNPSSWVSVAVTVCWRARASVIPFVKVCAPASTAVKL